MGTSPSVYFKTDNGVRPDGILSPRLFSLCIDDISTLLADMQVGCYIDSSCVNHFFMQTTFVYWPRRPLANRNLLMYVNNMVLHTIWYTIQFDLCARARFRRVEAPWQISAVASQSTLKYQNIKDDKR